MGFSMRIHETSNMEIKKLGGSLVIFTLFGVSMVRADPTCQPTLESQDYFNWHSCESDLDDHSWYGISKQNYTIQESRSQCAEYGGRLIVVDSPQIDQCVYYAMLEE